MEFRPAATGPTPVCHGSELLASNRPLTPFGTVDSVTPKSCLPAPQRCPLGQCSIFEIPFRLALDILDVDFGAEFTHYFRR
jgi:hypothetical protein